MSYSDWNLYQEERVFEFADESNELDIPRQYVGAIEQGAQGCDV